MARNKYDVDETLETKFDMKQIKRLFSYVGRYRKKLIMTIILMLFSSALGMVIPVLMQRVMDIYIPNHDKKGILLMAALAALIILTTAYILRIKIKWTSQIGQGIIHELRRELFIHLEELPFSYYDSRPHGKIQVRIVNYVNNISDLLSNGIVNTITDCCSLFFILGFMFYYSAPLTLICMCGLPILLAIVLFVKKKQRRGWQLASNKQSNLNAYIAESINGVRVTQAFVREDKNLGIFNNLSGSYRKAWMSVIKYNFMIGPTVQFISILATAAVYWVGIHWIMGGNDIISVGALTALTIYISQFWNPINTLASFYNSLLTAISYLERIFETIDEPVNVKDAPGAVEMPPIKGEVEFSHVVFSYEPGVRILNDVNFKANVGESFAIVGPTGAGKSTIVNLISRFYNIDSGKILIDGIDINSVTIKSLRKQMGVMMQDSFIFSGTIMDNIRYGNREASDEDVIRAAKTVCAHDFIMSMENGYQTQVNERGSRLSAGQRQLISFARALLADPKILILDEATSSIDTETELLLQQGLQELLKGRTSFIIAHRLSTIKSSSCIMYIDQGNILEKGTHDELMAKDGYYKELYMSQYAFLEKM